MKTIREIALTTYYPYGKNKENIIAERIFETDEALDKYESAIREDERNKMINVLMKFFPDEPCNYNGMDEQTACEWCSEHCDNHTVKECWEHAIKEKWYER